MNGAGNRYPIQVDRVTLAQIIIAVVEIWGLVGVVVALLFLTVGIDRIDPAARDAYAFRPLLIPGVVVIWPLVIWRWWTLERFLKNGCAAAVKPKANLNDESADRK